MKRVRASIRQGTWFALLALAINLALSFGHLHLEDISGGEITAGVLLTALAHQDGGQSDKHRGHLDDLCPICMAQAALGSGLAAAAPVLPVDVAYATLEPIFETERALPRQPRASFQSRAPPLS